MKVCAAVCWPLCQLLTSLSKFAALILAALAAGATAASVVDLEARVSTYSFHVLVPVLTCTYLFKRIELHTLQMSLHRRPRSVLRQRKDQLLLHQRACLRVQRRNRQYLRLRYQEYVRQMWKALVLNDYVESMQYELGISNSRRGDRRSPQIFEMYIQLEVLKAWCWKIK